MNIKMKKCVLCAAKCKMLINPTLISDYKKEWREIANIDDGCFGDVQESPPILFTFLIFGFINKFQISFF